MTVSEGQDADLLAEEFEAHRTRLRAVAYRMLGSVHEADDAVQEAWLRLQRTRGHREPRRLAHHRRQPGLPRHAACAVEPRSTPVAEFDEADALARRGTTRPRGRGRARRLRRPARSSSCCRRWRRPSGSRSCCTTCSRCPSTTSPRSSAAPPPRPGSSPAAVAGGCSSPSRSTEGGDRRARRRLPRRLARRATSRGCWRCSTPVPSYAPTPRPSRWAPRRCVSGAQEVARVLQRPRAGRAQGRHRRRARRRLGAPQGDQGGLRVHPRGRPDHRDRAAAPTRWCSPPQRVTDRLDGVSRARAWCRAR